MRSMSEACIELHTEDVAAEQEKHMQKNPGEPPLTYHQLKRKCRGRVRPKQQLQEKLNATWLLYKDRADANGVPLFADKKSAESVFQNLLKLAKEEALSGGTWMPSVSHC